MELSSSRLTLARHRMGLTKKQLAEKLGLSSRTISDYENNNKFNPSEETQRKLVEALGFPFDFYHGDTLAYPTRNTASFRALKRASACRRDAVLAIGAFGYLFNDWLESKFELPSPEVPPMLGESPDVAATSLRSHWQLGNRPIPNLIHLLESKGIRIFSLRDPGQGICREISAYSDWYDEKPFIFINYNKSMEHIRFSIAHELGHLILHDDTAQEDSNIEKEADRFASAFLMPADDIYNHAPKFVTISGLVQAKKRWFVSAMALIYRLHSLHLIGDWLYNSTCAEMSHFGYRLTEPDPMPHETSQILNKIFSVLRANHITVRDIANELCLPTEEINSLVHGLVYTVLENKNPQISVAKKPRANLRLIK
jgi:Zn-dependent peptidase ImmA (M78 family)/transcriptional regulator with XRE-family HTH domain